MDQIKGHKIKFNSETKLIPVADSHYLLTVYKPNIEHSFNINLDTLLLDQLDISLLYPEIKTYTKRNELL